MAQSSLDGIPVELQNAVISNITQPTDLMSLCLVSKQLRSIAIPFLYQTVNLDLLSWQMGTGFFIHDHPGHPHVRSLTIISPSSPSRHHQGTLKRAQIGIRLALQLIPRHGLGKFEVPDRMELDEETLVTLCTQQRNIIDISLGPLKGDRLGNMLQPLTWLPRLEAIDLPSHVHGGVEFLLYTKILKARARLKRLTFGKVSLLVHGEDMHQEPFIEDELEEGDLIFRKLFDHQSSAKGEATYRIEARELCFRETELVCLPRSIKDVFNVHYMQFLSLSDCDRVEDLLTYLVHGGKDLGLSLRGFIYNDNCGLSEIDASLVERFLKTFSGLVYLQIRGYLSEGGFDFTCLNGHASTLQHLYIGGVSDEESSNGEHRVSPEDAIQICEHAPNLQQLALSFPLLVLQDGKDGDFGDFGLTLDNISNLRDLEILRIIAWPVATARRSPTRCEEEYTAELSHLANTIIRRMSELHPGGATSRLKLLCIGNGLDLEAPIDTNGDDFKMNVMCFHIKRKIDSTGGVHLEVSPIKPMAVKFEVPIWDAIDHRFPYDHGLGLARVKSNR